MQIIKLNIYGFGKFHDTTISISNSFQLLYGENEAGKSTLVAFITSLLFGFETGKHRYAMYVPKQGSTYGGELFFTHHGEHYWLKRVSGTHGGEVTFRNLTLDQDLTKQDLNTMLRPLNKTLFQQIYCFDERALQAIFTLNRFDLTQRIQRIGAIGSDSWIGLTKQLTQDAQQLYKPRGRVQPLVTKLKQYDELTQKLESAKTQYAKYLTIEQTVQDTQRTQNEVTAQLKTRKAQVNQYQRLLSGFEDYQQVLALEQHAAESESTQHISTDDWQQVTQRYTKVVQLQQELDELSGHMTKNVAMTESQRFYESHQQQFDQLANQLPEQLANAHDLHSQEAQRTAFRRRLQGFETQYGLSLAHLQPLSAEAVTALTDLLQTKQRTSIEQETTTKQRQKHQQDFNRLSDQSTTTPTSGVDFKWLGAGIVVVLIALFALSGLFRTLGGVAGLLIAGYGIFKPTLNGTQRSEADSQLALLSSQLDADRRQLHGLDDQLTNLDAQLDQFGQQHQLTSVEPDQWLPIQTALREYHQVQIRLNETQQQIDYLSRSSRAFLSQWQFAGEVIGLGGDVDHQLSQINQFLSERQDESRRLQHDKQTEAAANLHRQSINQQLQDGRQSLAQALSTFGVSDIESFNQRYQAHQTLAEKTARAQALAKQLTEEDRQVLQRFSTQRDLNVALQSLIKQQNSLEGQHEANVQQLSEQRLALTQLANSHQYQDLLQKQADLQSDITQVTDQWLTKQLLIKWIDETLLNASKGRQPAIVTVAESVFQSVTDGGYTQIVFTDQTVQVVARSGVTYDVGELSSGTAEQLYVALRLAFTKVMADTVDMPIIIDDAFVNFDRGRTQHALSTLQDLTDSHQILYFTANQDNLQFVDDAQILDLNQLTSNSVMQN